MSATALRVAFIARSLLCIVFAWVFWNTRVTSAPDLAQLFARFVLLDGVSALIIAILIDLAGWHKAVAGIAAADGVMCLVAYAVLYLGPGIPYVAVTFALYAGLLAVFGGSFGVLDVIEAGRLRSAADMRGLSMILALAGLGAIALAITQFFMDPAISNYRSVLVAGAALQALTMLALAVRRPAATTRRIATP
jgi:hypothetical protein